MLDEDELAVTAFAFTPRLRTGIVHILQVHILQVRILQVRIQQNVMQFLAPRVGNGGGGRWECQLDLR
jgi:hypothetical protein